MNWEIPRGFLSEQTHLSQNILYGQKYAKIAIFHLLSGLIKKPSIVVFLFYFLDETSLL